MGPVEAKSNSTYVKHTIGCHEIKLFGMQIDLRDYGSKVLLACKSRNTEIVTCHRNSFPGSHQKNGWVETNYAPKFHMI